MPVKTTAWLAAGTIMAAVTAGPALAQAPSGQAPSSRAMLDCAAIDDDFARLACYDGLAKAMSPEARAMAEKREAESRRRAEAEAAEKAARAEADRKDRFGREGVLGYKGDPERIEQIEAKVTESLRDSLGKSVFILDNGQMWRQAEGFPMPPVKAGTAVVIKRGSLGSYRMTFDRMNRTVQVIRMR